MKITTKTGDSGITDIYNQRVDKCCDIVELLGNLDESASIISFAASLVSDKETKDELAALIPSITKIAASANKKESAHMGEELNFLEERISFYEESIKEIRLFDYPSKKEAAAIDYARCVVRRTERCAVRCRLNIRYLNRLSDYLFLVSRYIEYGENI